MIIQISTVQSLIGQTIENSKIIDIRRSWERPGLDVIVCIRGLFSKIKISDFSFNKQSFYEDFVKKIQDNENLSLLEFAKKIKAIEDNYEA